jgi:hypothetical protein
MSNLSRLALAAALVAASASMAFAQTYDPASDQSTRTRVSHARSVRTVTPRAERTHVAPQPHTSSEPWSSSFDPGMAGGGF